MRRILKRYVVQPMEAALALFAYGLFRLLPVDAASAFGGWIGRTVGPRLKVDRVARRNLARIFPGLDSEATNRIIAGMWDNIGRTIGEHPHLDAFDPYRDAGRVEIVNGEIVDTLRDDGRPGLWFAGHLANWELQPLTVSRRGLPLNLFYRAPNNPLFDRLMLHGRRVLGGRLLPKGSPGARAALELLRGGEHVAMLVDQKMNDGIAVPFLGIEAMTAPALAQLALRFDCPVVPVQVERLGGARFRVTFFPPMARPAVEDRRAAILEMMTEVNRLLGEWIRARPEQWLWIHNRWPAD
jgi:KDO2-lipid IV(A) lauroyltransferase